MQRLEASINAMDLDGVMSAYIADDSLFLFDLTPPRQYVGVSAVPRNWRNNSFGEAKGPINYSIMDVAIATDGEFAYSHSIQRLLGMDVRGHSVDVTMRFSDNYRKVGGGWYIVMEHVSVPIDFGALRLDLSSRP